jgi:tRNA(Ile)-lysidine synthase
MHQIIFLFFFFFTQFDARHLPKILKYLKLPLRELRYSWFYEIFGTKDYDYILTAHHADDALETTYNQFK